MENLDLLINESHGVERKRDYDEDPPTLEVQASSENAFKSGERGRKRKFIYNSEAVNVKRGRFYYLNQQMTKPRRTKIVRETKRKLQTTVSDSTKKQKLHFVRSDDNGKVYLMYRGHQKSDVFFTEEIKCNMEASKKLDLTFHIVDEIALEGLDGITLEAFWKRLKNVFPNHLSKTVADRIWRMICGNKRISFYILKEPREKLVAFDKFHLLDPDDGIFVEPFTEFKDIYPLASINGTDIRGSCSTYGDRKENNGLRKFSMDKAIKLYDQKLVFVADQALRNKALINEEADPTLDLVDVEYCMLERIGRSREHGELSHGKLPNVNDKKVYHNRKILIQNSLITSQAFCLKSFASQINITGSLVHLPRFYSKKKSKQVMAIEQMDKMLREAPNLQMDWNEVMRLLGRSSWMVKLVKTSEFRRLFKLTTVLYRKIYPNAIKVDYMSKTNGKEKQIRVLKLIDPNVNVTAVLDQKEAKEECINVISNTAGHKLFNYEYLRDIFLYIMSTGKNGAILSEIYEHIKMDFYSVRMAVRKLLTKGVIVSEKIDSGRQQMLRFIARSFFDPAAKTTLTEKVYKLSTEKVQRVFKKYNKTSKDRWSNYCDEEPQENVALPLVIDKPRKRLVCSVFHAEQLDTVSEDITIYDIILKGLDRLLLIQSNLFDHYISEWDDMILKKELFFAGVNALNCGFGVLIYEFLHTLNFAEELMEDGNIIFNLHNIPADAKILSNKSEQRILEMEYNLSTLYCSYYTIDLIGKMYLFEAMFNDKHISINTMKRIKELFSYIMSEEGKKRCKDVETKSRKTNIEVELSNSVVMEKFMGSKPVLLLTEEEDDVKIEIYGSSDPVKFKKIGTMYQSNNDDDITQRYINRANLLLNMIYRENIVKDMVSLCKEIRKEENEEGYDKTVCKKSVVSILRKLVEDGYIKIYKVIISNKSTTRSQIFICTTEVEHDHPLIITPIEQLKLKFYSSTSQTKPVKIKNTNQRSPFGFREIQQSVDELKFMTSTKLLTDCRVDRMIGKHYGYSPKFVRMRVLHELLFYVIRELTETRHLENLEKIELFQKCKIKVSTSQLNEMPPVYKRDVNWKMFIPPLPRNSKWPLGWALMCDVILRMPLSVFVKIHNIPYEIPELEKFLKHPIKKHYLIKYLPASIINALLHKRKYFNYIFESMRDLAYVGLLQLGPRNFKERDQIFLYLNSKASLVDTTKSAPGYNQIENKEYKRIPFEFRTCKDLDVFWSEMFRICLNTQLGKRKVLDGQCVTIEDSHAKPALMATLDAKEFQQAVQEDTGKIPGDCMGAAGFDSSLWSFLKRNWSWAFKSQKNKQSSTVDSLGLKPIRYDLLPKDYRKSCKKNSIKTVKSVVIKRNKKKFVIRKIVAPKNVKVKEYYDAIDKAIMKKNPTLRVEWDKEEDKLLRYSRAALMFLCPQLKKQYISYSTMRDVLHRLYPKSKNKTSKAMQRRIYVLLTNDESIKIMEGNVQNFLNSDKLRKYFECIRHRFDYDIKISDSQLIVAYIYLMAYIVKHQKEIEFLLLGYVATYDFFADANIDALEPLLQNEVDTSVAATYKNPENLDEVTKNTIKTVIHCSMACRKSFTNWSLQLSHIYKKFQDDIVRTAVTELKKTQSFVMNKNNDKGLTNNLPFPIKFSFLYKTMKQSAYTIDMYKESFKLFEQIICQNNKALNFITYNELWNLWENQININFEIPEMGIILNPEIGDHSEVIDELAKRLLLYLEKICKKSNEQRNRSNFEKKYDETDQIPQERDPEEVKRDFLQLIFRIPYLLVDNREMYFRKTMESNIHLEINNYIYLMIVDLKSVVQDKNIVHEKLDAFIARIDEAANIENQDILLKNLAKVVFVIQTIHQEKPKLPINFDEAFAEWETNQFDDNGTQKNENTSPHKKRHNKNLTNGMEVCINRAKAGDFPSLEEIKDGMMMDGDEHRSVPHITDLIMFLNEGRYPELDSDYETIERFKEHFIVQYPTVKEFMIDDLDEFKEQPIVRDITDGSKFEKIRKKAEGSIKQPKLDEIMKYDGTQEDLKIIQNLLDFIKSKKEIGVEATEIKSKFSEEGFNLAALMEHLTDLGVLLRTGISSILYVYYEYEAEWITETFLSIPEAGQGELVDVNVIKSLIEKGSEVTTRKVQLRPWTMLDGTLNYSQFQEWLCIVLSKCVDYPNIPFRLLCEQFCHIQPVDVYYLLEVLKDIGCLNIYTFEKTENTLFSERCIINEMEATCLDNFDNMFIKVCCTSASSFGFFLNNDVFIDC